MNILADIWDTLTRNELSLGVLFIIAAVTTYILIITAIGKTREFFGRKPPFDEDLAKHAASVEQIKRDLAGLPTNEKLNELVSKLGNFATLTQLAEVKIGLSAEMDKIEKHAANQRAELWDQMRHYIEDANLRGERLSALEAESKTHTRQLTGIDQRIGALTEALGYQRGKTEARRA